MFPRAAFGARSTPDIRPTDIIALVRGIETLGRIKTAHVVRTRCSQIFRFAIAAGRAKADPASLLRGAMVRQARGGFAGPRDPK